MKDKDFILLRDPDHQRCEETARLLHEHYDCGAVETVAEAYDILTRRPCHVSIVQGCGSVAHGVAFCRELHQRHPEVKIVLIADAADHGPLIDAFNENCLFRCLIEPVTPLSLMNAVRAAVRRYEMERVQTLLVQRAEEIDAQIHTIPYWLYRFRMSLDSLVRMVAGSVGLCIVAGIVLLMAAIGVFLLLYYIKSALGIDFFADKHLKDFILQL